MIKVEYLGKRRWRLLDELTIIDVTVPKGFVFDGASAPRFFWWVIPPMQDTAVAAAVHDYLCRTGEKPRKTADKYFLAALLVYSDINIFRCLAGYAGVRIGALFGIGGTSHETE